MDKNQDIINDRDDRKVSQEQFEEETNIYEAVMILGQRMRQIERRNAREFEKVRNAMMDDRTEKEYNKEFVADINVDDLPVFPKAIRLCMNNMLNDELEWEYEDITKLED
ncbi:MAG: hypothetical protein PHF33_04520 [Candidatus Delongbacteria bacterium]|jgi:hypothetical protein|nr:hypothetical protein [Candidatus Delongbacteria bacterium]MDD4205151.1 hypothetical protein [Candidatus Delongbacteria bacterium]MDY0017742.1 hypothetical protein [Candidatus Delongbacteria bacterium]